MRRVGQEAVVAAGLHIQHQAGLEEAAVEGEVGTPCWVGGSLSWWVVV